ncbi:MAG: hypothetical protein JWO20_2196, partial [Candidatus Angelobacter sp.]|nr:hypothetical protein [Candidatus Angelobacter sp.]
MKKFLKALALLLLFVLSTFAIA